MSSREKLLTVASLRGREVAIRHKGGEARPSHPRTDEEYVALIDRAYQDGDQKTVTAIWEEQTPR
jgi:hypothetical protein